ncbi:hypothetical protein NLG97_g3550 [Lecanicillium saksenae]|uniref:Uncharacterized protein n=1 Tax=Lecanicillium saksenae TaxID=468837 RepID=A0ACC1R0F5_9HYPO|nr:hypothetical protein NLG97_g3550 [Lecanicillium saksenae]
MDQSSSYYGEFPIDCYVMKHWDFDQPVETDAEQWKSLVRAYLDLNRRERVAYHLETNEYMNRDKQPPAEVIARCLAPFQTVQEREVFCNESPSMGPRVVRTYYGEDLEESYKAMLGIDVPDLTEFNNRSLYEGLDIEEIILRMPQLPDQPQMSVVEDVDYYEELDGGTSPPYEELVECSIQKASRDAETVLFVADMEAMQEQLLKIKWIDYGGRCVWESRIQPDNVRGFEGLHSQGFSLHEFHSEDSVSGDVIMEGC